MLIQAENLSVYNIKKLRIFYKKRFAVIAIIEYKCILYYRSIVSKYGQCLPLFDSAEKNTRHQKVKFSNGVLLTQFKLANGDLLRLVSSYKSVFWST